jgi:hypothetical protein
MAAELPRESADADLFEALSTGLAVLTAVQRGRKRPGPAEAVNRQRAFAVCYCLVTLLRIVGDAEGRP